MGSCSIKKSHFQDLSIKDPKISTNKLRSSVIVNLHHPDSKHKFQFVPTKQNLYSVYTKFQQKGEGGFGIVYSATEIRSGISKAIKIIPKATT